jgi:hypothetical protein
MLASVFHALCKPRKVEQKSLERSGRYSDVTLQRGESSMNLKTIMAIAILGSAPFLGGCAKTVMSSEYSPRDVGELFRAEPATVLSQRYVKLKNWNNSKRGGTNTRAVNYIIKLDRTGETLSVTQRDDVFIASGAQAWVEFGERIRLAPRS